MGRLNSFLAIWILFSIFVKPIAFSADDPTSHQNVSWLFRLMDLSTTYAIPAMLETPEGPRFGFLYTGRCRLRLQRFLLTFLLKHGPLREPIWRTVDMSLVYLLTRIFPLGVDLAWLPNLYFFETEGRFDPFLVEFSHDPNEAAVSASQGEMMHLRRIARGWQQKVLDSELYLEDAGVPRIARVILTTSSKRGESVRPPKVVRSSALVEFVSAGQVIAERTIPLERLSSRYVTCASILELLW
jgi:hypothetical protein